MTEEEILEEEILSAMALLGVTKLSDLDTNFVRPAKSVRRPGLTSAFHLLNIDGAEY